MVDNGTAEERASEDVLLHEDRATNASDHLEQSSPTAENVVRRKKTAPPKEHAYKLPLIVFSLIFITLATAFTLTRFYSIYAVAGPSMEPTLHSGQTIIIKNEEHPVRGALILFHKPTTWPNFKQENDLLIKRLYGLPGDELQVKDGNLYINSSVVSKLPKEYECSVKTYSHKLAKNEYFVMGDNALHSLDSRRVLCDGKDEESFVDKERMVGYGNVVAKF